MIKDRLDTMISKEVKASIRPGIILYGPLRYLGYKDDQQHWYALDLPNGYCQFPVAWVEDLIGTHIKLSNPNWRL
jgi:hypothetical protein